MSEMSLLDASGAERGKSSRASPVAGQHASLTQPPPKAFKYTRSMETHAKALFLPNVNMISKDRSREHVFNIGRLSSSTHSHYAL